MSHEPRREEFQPSPRRLKNEEKLFWFVLGVFVGAHWIVAMASIIRWLQNS